MHPFAHATPTPFNSSPHHSTLQPGMESYEPFTQHCTLQLRMHCAHTLITQFDPGAIIISVHSLISYHTIRPCSFNGISSLPDLLSHNSTLALSLQLGMLPYASFTQHQTLQLPYASFTLHQTLQLPYASFTLHQTLQLHAHKVAGYHTARPCSRVRTSARAC